MNKLNIFKKIKYKNRSRCVVCDIPVERPAIYLPKFPLTEIYLKFKVDQKIGFIDQEFHVCKNCGHGQVNRVIDPNILYGYNYKTRTSTSSSAISAIDTFLLFIDKTLKKKRIKTILEVGCNDLYMLRKMKNRAEVLYGIDPILKGIKPGDPKIKVIGDFFENVDLQKLGCEPDVVLSSHTLEHIENPKKMIENLLNSVSPNTLLFFQFPGLETLVDQAHFDQVFHQHLNYFSLQSVIYMLNELGAELIDYEVNPYHWGSIMIAFRKSNANTKKSNLKFSSKIQSIPLKYIQSQYNIFKENMSLISRRLEILKDKDVYGYGAALMLPILYYYINGLKNLKYILDEDVNKRGLYYLNFPVEIRLPKVVKNLKNKTVVVTAINSMQAVRAIVKNLIDIGVREVLIPSNLI